MKMNFRKSFKIKVFVVMSVVKIGIFLTLYFVNNRLSATEHQKNFEFLVKNVNITLLSQVERRLV
jgi:hypothetical protein